MNATLQQAFNKSVAALEQGESLDKILARHPEHRDELRSLLRVVQHMRKQYSAQPNRSAQLRSRTAMLSRAQELRGRSPGKNWLAPVLQWGFAAAFSLLFILIAGGFGLSAASAQSLPGDRLYSVKRTAERIQLNLTAGETNRLNLTIFHDNQRVSEVQRLLAQGRVVEVGFEAQLLSRSGSLWQFDNVPVLVTSQTHIPSGLREGDVIQVRGRTTPHGWVRAYSFAAVGLTFDGQIEAIKSDQWVIGGRNLTVLPNTKANPDLKVGDLVRVVARTELGVLVAQSISPIELSATPIPTLAPSEPDPTPTPTPIPEPTETEEDPDQLVGFDLNGILQQQEANRWQIDGFWIYLNPTTELEGSFQPGVSVRARGIIQADGRYLADEIRQLDDGDDKHDEETATEPPTIDEEPNEDSTPESENDESEDDEENETEEDETEEIEFSGVVESIQSGRWRIAGRTLIITAETDIEGNPEVGDEVRVDAEETSDGTLYAEEIKLDD